MRMVLVGEKVERPPRADIKRLKRRLLEFGGEGFQYDWFLNSELTEEDVEALLSRGIAMDGRDAEVRRMTTSECHRNAAKLAARYPNRFSYCTGLALSEDGIWRVHSWAVGLDGRIVETTEPRIKYFGYRLTPKEFRGELLRLGLLGLDAHLKRRCLSRGTEAMRFKT